MITFGFTLVPGGIGLLRDDLASGTLFTTDDGKHHHLVVRDKNYRVVLDHFIPKTQSGHKNLLHVLRDILNDADLDSLGKDYLKTVHDD